MYKLIITQCADPFVFAVFATSDYSNVKSVKVSGRYRVRVCVCVYTKISNCLI
jgi:hypothetical protein